MPRRVLILAHRFPPRGGAGVQRTLQLTRHLPEAGFTPVVVTGPGHAESRWTPPDEALADERVGAAVHRLPLPEPPHDVTWEGRLERWFRVSSRWRRWWASNVLATATSVGGDIAVVHASLAPYATAEAAVAVAQRLRKPLLVDLEDPWALDEMMVYPSRLHRALELRRMRRVLGTADMIVMNAPEARLRVLNAFPELSPARVVAIPNAFDPNDFEGPPPTRNDDCFRIVHTGSLHTDLGEWQRSRGRLRRFLGGTFPGVDFFSRSHVYLLEALQAALDEHPELNAVVEVHLAGVFTAEDRAVADRFAFVRLHEFLPHDETINLMRSADLLFLPMHDLPAGVRAGLVPHKTYEYLASGRPILAAVPEGDARDLLQGSGAAVFCPPSDARAMARLLLEEVEAWRSGERRRAPDPAVVARCSATRLVRELAAAYEELLSGAAMR